MFKSGKLSLLNVFSSCLKTEIILTDLFTGKVLLITCYIVIINRFLFVI